MNSSHALHHTDLHKLINFRGEWPISAKHITRYTKTQMCLLKNPLCPHGMDCLYAHSRYEKNPSNHFDTKVRYCKFKKRCWHIKSDSCKFAHSKNEKHPQESISAFKNRAGRVCAWIQEHGPVEWRNAAPPKEEAPPISPLIPGILSGMGFDPLSPALRDQLQQLHELPLS